MKKVLKYFAQFINDGILLLATYLPGSIGYKLRYWFWKKKLFFLGENVKIEVGTYFTNPQFISIDSNCWIDRGVIILAGPDNSNRSRRYIHNKDFAYEKGRVYIGKFVHIGPYSIISGIGGVFISDKCGFSSGVKLYSFSNHYRSDDNPTDRTFHFGPLLDHDKQFMVEGPIFLDRNVGVALNAILLPGISIGQDSFVAMNSVVYSSFTENSFIAGNPARLVKSRFDEI